MLKGLLGSIAVAGLLALVPLSTQAAEIMDCTDANTMKANGDMDKMAAGEKKTMGMKETSMAKEMMEKKDMAGCKTYMNKAIEMGMEK
jgi:hypothetical protein